MITLSTWRKECAIFTRKQNSFTNKTYMYSSILMCIKILFYPSSHNPWRQRERLYQKIVTKNKLKTSLNFFDLYKARTVNNWRQTRKHGEVQANKWKDYKKAKDGWKLNTISLIMIRLNTENLRDCSHWVNK